jgi:hypothetical protein
MKTNLSAGLLAAAVGAAAALPARAAPAQVVIIRHGEKPDSGNELNERGFARARALVDYFQHDPAAARFGPPAAIYAMSPKDESGSLRPIETVTPLAEALGLTIRTDYLKDQLPQLVADVLADPRYNGKTVLICWEHKVIPELARDFGWEGAPAKWSGAVFDRAWIIGFSGSRAASFRDEPEHVLPGDSAD